MSICPRSVTQRYSQTENWMGVSLSNLALTPSILKINTTVFSTIASFLSVPERVAVSVTCQGLHTSADISLWRSMAVKMNIQHLRDKYGSYNQAIQHALKTDAFTCFVLNPFVNKLECNFKITPTPGYKPSIFDQDSRCALSLSTFKELVQEHFNTHNSPYFAALVEDSQKCSALYDLTTLSACYASKNWTTGAFTNPMNRVLCERVQLYGITKFGAFALGAVRSCSGFHFYFQQFENTEGVSIIKPTTFLKFRLVSNILSPVLSHHLLDFSDKEILNWHMLRLSEKKANIDIKSLANFIINRDSEEKVYLFLERIAEKLSSEALVDLGACYQKDIINPLPLSKALAFACYTKAAALNNPMGFFNLGLCYARNSGVGSSRLNKFIAFECYRKAAEDFNLPEAWLRLGSCYDYDMGEPTLAFECYKKAADLNHPQALFNLGVCYDTNSGVAYSPLNKLLAFEYYEKAANLDCPQALYNLGICYEEGVGVKPSPLNKVRAFECYERAAKLNHSKSILRLGIYYQHDIGVNPSPLNKVLAFECFKKAAKDFNLPEALFNVAISYEENIKVKFSPANRAFAINCYKKATKFGVTEVVLTNNLREMSKDRIDEEYRIRSPERMVQMLLKTAPMQFILKICIISREYLKGLVNRSLFTSDEWSLICSEWLNLKEKINQMTIENT